MLKKCTEKIHTNYKETGWSHVEVKRKSINHGIVHNEFRFVIDIDWYRFVVVYQYHWFDINKSQESHPPQVWPSQ